MSDNDFFGRMCKEAIEELASGDKGWRGADTNTLLLACFGMLTNHLSSKLAKPMWFFACTAFTGVVGFFIMQLLS